MKSGLLFFALFLAISSFAQDSSFQIKDYKFRTPRYRTLNLNIGLSGSTYNEENTQSNTRREKYLNLGPALVSYTKVVSTEKRLAQSTIQFSPVANFSSITAINNVKTTYSSFRPYANWSFNNRFYHDSRWFWEVGNAVSVMDNQYTVKEAATSQSSQSLSLTNSINLGFGKGRIEQVQDAQMAVYLLKDLADNGLLQSNPTEELTTTLARLVTEIRTTRVFDIRRRRIYELKRLDSFFRNSGLVPVTDIRHFTTINDDWSFAFNPLRYSGNSWYVRLQPSVNYMYNYDDRRENQAKTFSTLHYTSVLLAPLVGYENYKPVSLKWQHNFGGTVSYGKSLAYLSSEYVSVTSGGKTKIDSSAWTGIISAFYGLGFYPNTRTAITTTATILGRFDNKKNLLLLPELVVEANYFIGYRTYLAASANIGYQYSKLEAAGITYKQTAFSSALSLGLSHTIF